MDPVLAGAAPINAKALLARARKRHHRISIRRNKNAVQSVNLFDAGETAVYTNLKISYLKIDDSCNTVYFQNSVIISIQIVY